MSKNIKDLKITIGKDEKKVFYLCDRRKCEKCNGLCSHTSDINHAKNFEKLDNVLWEVDEQIKELALHYED